MPPVRTKPRTSKISIADLKKTTARLLPRDHALNRLLRHVPDEMTAGELAISLDHFLALVDEE